MVRHLEAFGDQMDDFISEVDRTIGHETVRETECGAPFYDGGGGVFGESVREREETLLV